MVTSAAAAAGAGDPQGWTVWDADVFEKQTNPAGLDEGDAVSRSNMSARRKLAKSSPKQQKRGSKRE